MPLYEFKCRQCEHVFEVRQAWKDPLPECPECHGEVRKVLQAPALVFKGSGWHVNDYGKTGPNPSSKSSSKSTESASPAPTPSSSSDSTSSTGSTKTDSSSSSSSKTDSSSS